MYQTVQIKIIPLHKKITHEFRYDIINYLRASDISMHKRVYRFFKWLSLIKIALEVA